ncbi:hypothetical protein [Pseudomonas sp. NPDC089569]|uniref:hypothetical protein n=1 Tax=Pseudomonas sp. NPDC089569 TaxID=3390722 RepID=UPI003D018887
MQRHDPGLPVIQVLPITGKRADHQAEFKYCVKQKGKADMEPRVIELEAHLKYLRKDMEEVRNDVKSIKHRLAYSAGGTAVVLGLLGWIANSRFDQLVTLLLAH